LRPGETPILLIAGGSGITPCISLVKYALAGTKRKVKLVYANQNADSVIYRDQLDWLERQFGDRFICRHWLDDRQGLMMPEDVAELSKGWEPADSCICGPDPLMDMTEETLGKLFGASARILTERFLSPDDPEASALAASVGSATPLIESFRLILDGQEHKVPVVGGETLLAAALAAGIDVPNSCTEGHCGTCIAQLRSGEVSMASTRALSRRNIQRGLVLACQSRPSSPVEILLDFDI
jgi:ferredoxin-NADP reductase